MKKKSIEYIESQEKKHYQSLRDLFKWIVGSLTIMFSVGAALIGANVFQINERVNNELIIARKEIQSLKSESNKYLQNLKVRTDLQIELIEREAKINALSAIELQIDEELKSPRVQEYLYNEMKKNIENNLDILAQESFNKAASEFVDFTKQTIELNTAFQNAYWNDVSKIKFIDSVSYYSQDKELRIIARSLLSKIETAYKNWYDFKDKTNRIEQYKKYDLEADGLSNKELEEYLTTKIAKETNSVKLTKQFCTYVDLIDDKINLFEFHKIKKNKNTP